MPAEYLEGFSVREVPWHGMGEVLEEYPGREEAQHKCGHDFEVLELTAYADTGTELVPIPGVKSLMAVYADGHTEIMPSVPEDSFTIIQNDTAWDVVDALVGKVDNVHYETGLKLGDGLHSVLAWLDEPVIIPGDNSPTFPWINVSWGFKRGQPLSARSTAIRTVCRNTQTAAEAQGERYGTNYVFTHTKNVMARIEKAMEAIRYGRDQFEEYVEIAREFAEIPVTENQRELFVTQIIRMPPEALISEVVMGNVEASRAKLRGLFNGPTIPEAHALTAYGLHLAGGEYLDHLRGWRNPDTYFGRSMLKHEPAKAKMTRLIREVVKA